MIEWLDAHLVPGWRESWRWFSVQAALVFGAIGTAIAGNPELLPLLAAMLGGSEIVQAIVLAAAFAVIVLRFWNQEADDGETD